MSRFLYDTVLPAKEICNLETEKKKLVEICRKGERAVVFGWRNTGKTSLLKNVIIPDFKAKHPKGLVVFVDFMGVRSMNSIKDRMRIAFESAVSLAKPGKSYLATLGKTFKALRPTMTVDSLTGELAFSLGVEKSVTSVELSKIVQEIGNYHDEHNALIIFDEFQDISFVAEADAIFRDYLQNLPGDLPVIISGSKKHMLSHLFSTPRMPLANWGQDIQIPTILSNNEYMQKYQAYIQKKLGAYGLTIQLDAFDHLFKMLLGIPEPVNMVCQHFCDNLKGKTKITSEITDLTIAELVLERETRFAERLSKNNENENLVLCAIAKNQPVVSPKGKNFLYKLSSLSPTTVFTIMKRLEDEADIYKLETGYVVSDPLLAAYMRRFR